MAEPQINESDKDGGTKPSTPETQTVDAALSRLITINEDFTQAHAVQAVSEIKVSILSRTTIINHPLTNTDLMA
jgi:hypothetical protein